MLCDVFSGWVAGMMGFAVGHPIDTVKVHQQVKSLPAIKTIKYIHGMRGLRGFYQGMGLPFMTTGFLNALFFGIYGPVCDAFVMRRAAEMNAGNNSTNTTIQQEIMDEKLIQSECRVPNFKFKESEGMNASYMEMFLAGCVAGAVQLIFLTPIDLVKIKLQSQFGKQTFTGPYHCITKISKEAGVLGLYRGFVPLAVRDIPGSGVYVAAYEYLRYELYMAGCPKLFAQSIAGGFAGIISWAVVIPFDVVKSRMQADDYMNPKYRGMNQCMSEIFREKGLQGLFRGFWSASFRAFPVNAATFVVYQGLVDNCKDKSPSTRNKN